MPSAKQGDEFRAQLEGLQWPAWSWNWNWNWDSTLQQCGDIFAEILFGTGQKAKKSQQILEPCEWEWAWQALRVAPPAKRRQSAWAADCVTYTHTHAFRIYMCACGTDNLAHKFGHTRNWQAPHKCQARQPSQAATQCASLQPSKFSG